MVVLASRHTSQSRLSKPVAKQQLTNSSQTGPNLYMRSIWQMPIKVPMTHQKFSPSIYWIFGNRLLAVNLAQRQSLKLGTKLQRPDSLEYCAAYRQLVDCCLQIVDRLSLSAQLSLSLSKHATELSLSASKHASEPRQSKICSGLGPGSKTSATAQSRKTRVAKCNFLLTAKLSNLISFLGAKLSNLIYEKPMLTTHSTKVG